MHMCMAAHIGLLRKRHNRFGAVILTCEVWPDGRNMRIVGYWLGRRSFYCLAMLLAIPLAEAVVAQPQQTLSGQQTQSVSAVQSQPQTPESRAGKAELDASQSDVAIPDGPVPVGSQAADQSGQSATSQSNSEYQQDSAQRPVGSAAAPYEKTTGVAASSPAGAVIAPAKQRRARSILIRVGVIVGGAVAIGTVVALSRASPSRPN
jgi:uncharacterized membrane protein